jgi:hypothetical protein
LAASSCWLAPAPSTAGGSEDASGAPPFTDFDFDFDFDVLDDESLPRETAISKPKASRTPTPRESGGMDGNALSSIGGLARRTGVTVKTMRRRCWKPRTTLAGSGTYNYSR